MKATGIPSRRAATCPIGPCRVLVYDRTGLRKHVRMAHGRWALSQVQGAAIAA